MESEIDHLEQRLMTVELKPSNSLDVERARRDLALKHELEVFSYAKNLVTCQLIKATAARDAKIRDRVRAAQPWYKRIFT